MTKPNTAAEPSAAQEDPSANESDARQAPADAAEDGADNPDGTVSFISRRTLLPDSADTQDNAQPDAAVTARKPSDDTASPDEKPSAAEPVPAGKKMRARKKQGPRQSPGKGKTGPTKPLPKQGRKQPQPTVQIRPVAGPATLKKRHWGLMASFLMLALVPWVAIVAYLFVVAEDQYHSVAGFTVRSQEQSGANELIGGLAQFAGVNTASDSDILYEFIQSQEMVQAVDAQIGLREHYAQHWPNDWAFSIWQDASQEDLIWYWNRMVGVSYDSSTGLIEVQVKAFAPDMAQDIAKAIVDVSQQRINDLNLQAREDAMRYAQDDLDEAVALLKNAREALTVFRTKSQIVDPETDIQTRMGVMTSLQQQLAEALVEHDLLRGTATQNDPRLKDVSQRIQVIRDRIATERQNFSSSSTDTGGVTEDYPTLISEFERLTVDREYAEKAYFAALTAFETARDEANRQSRYLATYIKPTLAEASEYPQRFFLSGLIGLFLLLTWSIMALIYYSIRDRA